MDIKVMNCKAGDLLLPRKIYCKGAAPSRNERGIASSILHVRAF